jgi:bifunctional enzyme CysN/CysC
VQWVNRPNQNFRGYAGRIASGRVRVGDEIAVLPSGRRSTVSRIVTFDGDLVEAVTGQSVTLTLADEVDCSRGNILAAVEAAAEPVSRIEATLVWMADETLVPHRSYWLKVGAQTASASVSAIGPIVDVNTMEQRRGITLGLNDIGEAQIDLDRDIPPVLYADNRRLGGFILIDKVTHATVAAGLVTGFPSNPLRRDREGPAAGSIVWVTGADRAAWAQRAAERQRALGRPSFVLDREALGGLLGEDAAETVRRAREVAKLMSAAQVNVFLTIDALREEATPGRVVDAGDGEPGGADEWVI